MIRSVTVMLSLVLSLSSIGQSNQGLIKSHLDAITQTKGYRNHSNLEVLNSVASYIKRSFEAHTDSVWFQSYRVNGQEYKNVICSFGTENTERIVIGAHYDVCGNQEGADDNASGVVGLLELARMLKEQNLSKRIDLVAYTLEEPPYFRTEYMGSYIHAKSLAEQKVKVSGMISLEMIGFFKDQRKTQDYPLGALSLIYGNKGNYITLVKKFGAGRFVRQFSRRFKKAKLIRTKKFTGPPSLPGIDFSDHLNYWQFGFPALMITDTAFYRNKNYHEKTDVVSTLNTLKMGLVIDSVFESLIVL